MVLQFPRFWAEGCRGDDAESTGLHIDTGRIENPRIRRIESLCPELQLLSVTWKSLKSEKSTFFTRSLITAVERRHHYAACRPTQSYGAVNGSGPGRVLELG